MTFYDRISVFNVIFFSILHLEIYSEMPHWEIQQVHDSLIQVSSERREELCLHCKKATNMCE